MRRRLRAPIEKVFDVISDHAGYVAFKGVRRASLLRRGPDDEPNGVGAVRELDLGVGWFREEVTAFQRPTRMDYVITASRPAMRHRGGTIVLHPAQGDTLVEWTTTFSLALPLVSPIATRAAAAIMRRSFDAMLREVERRAQKP